VLPARPRRSGPLEVAPDGQAAAVRLVRASGCAHVPDEAVVLDSCTLKITPQ
jgi:hypothetical protein